MDQLRIFDRRRIDGYFVRACPKDLAEIFDAADAAAHGERHEDLRSRAAHHIDHGAAALMAGGDVQKDDLVRALFIVHHRIIDWIAHFFDAHEIDALDDLAVADVQAGNDAFG